MIDLYGQAAQATIIDMRDYRSPDCLVVGGLADSAVTTASFGTLLDTTDTLRLVLHRTSHFLGAFSPWVNTSGTLSFAEFLENTLSFWKNPLRRNRLNESVNIKFCLKLLLSQQNIAIFILIFVIKAPHKWRGFCPESS